jgi:hypothetical protein
MKQADIEEVTERGRHKEEKIDEKMLKERGLGRINRVLECETQSEREIHTER